MDEYGYEEWKKRKNAPKKKMTTSTFGYYRQFKDYKYPFNEVENEQELSFLTEIADLLTKEIEFAKNNKLKSPGGIQIRGKNDGKVSIIYLFINGDEFAQKFLPFFLKIPEYFPGILHLNIVNNSSIKLIPGNYFQDFIQLKELVLESIKITELPNLDSCNNLEILGIHNALKLQTLSPLAHLINLEKLYIKNVPKLHTIPPLAPRLPDLTKRLAHNFKTLENNRLEHQRLSKIRHFAPDMETYIALNSDNRIKIQNLRIESAILTDENTYELDKLTHLKELSIIDAPELQSIQSLDNLYRLRVLEIRNAPKLRTLPSFGSTIVSSRIDFKNLGITALPEGFGKFGMGSQLFLIECPNLQTIPPSWCNFSEIIIDDCLNFRTLPQCLLEDKKYNPENTPVIEMFPQIHISYYPPTLDLDNLDATSNPSKLQISDAMQKRVKIRQSEDFKRELEEHHRDLSKKLIREDGEEILSGKSFCFTGKLHNITRNEAEERVLSLGGQLWSGVAKSLNFLVTNDPGSGSSKNVKARELGVEIITEQEFLEIINR